MNSNYCSVCRVSHLFFKIFQDEKNWPNNGEIDIIEEINFQTVANTALHTSKDCDMFAHVTDYVKTGKWEWSSEFEI